MTRKQTDSEILKELKKLQFKHQVLKVKINVATRLAFRDAAKKVFNIQ